MNSASTTIWHISESGNAKRDSEFCLVLVVEPLSAFCLNGITGTVGTLSEYTFHRIAQTAAESFPSIKRRNHMRLIDADELQSRLVRKKAEVCKERYYVVRLVSRFQISYAVHTAGKAEGGCQMSKNRKKQEEV